MYWSIILGDDTHPGYDVEIVSGLKEGAGLDNVGVEPAWAEENLGTPFEKGGPLMVRFIKRLHHRHFVPHSDQAKSWRHSSPS